MFRDPCTHSYALYKLIGCDFVSSFFFMFSPKLGGIRSLEPSHVLNVLLASSNSLHSHCSKPLLPLFPTPGHPNPLLQESLAHPSAWPSPGQSRPRVPFTGQCYPTFCSLSSSTIASTYPCSTLRFPHSTCSVLPSSLTNTFDAMRSCLLSSIRTGYLLPPQQPPPLSCLITHQQFFPLLAIRWSPPTLISPPQQ